MSSGCYHGLRTGGRLRGDATGRHAAVTGAVAGCASALADRLRGGYGGSGPAQLALALLLDVGADAAVALNQAFKAERVQRWSGPCWDLDSGELAKWLAGRGCAVLVCPSGEPHDWKPEWVSGDTWHGGTEYRSTCCRCGL